MDSKSIIATVIGSLVKFVGGFLIYGLALNSFMASLFGVSGVNKTEPEIHYIYLGCLFFALLITLIFARWAGIKTAATGAKVGALIALLMSLTHGFIMKGTTNIMDGFAMIGVSAIAELVIGALTGAAIGWWLGRE